MDDILGEIYVPSKYSQNIFTSVSWDVCSVNVMYANSDSMQWIGKLVSTEGINERNIL